MKEMVEKVKRIKLIRSILSGIQVYSFADNYTWLLGRVLGHIILISKLRPINALCQRSFTPSLIKDKVAR